MEFQEVVDRRHMVRRYKTDPVPAAAVEAIVANLQRGPSAGFSQGFGFLVLDRAEHIARFRTASTPDEAPENWYAATFDAPLVIVACSNKGAYLDRYAEPDKGFADRSDAWWPAPYWDIDTGFAALLALLTAVDRGLGACFFGIPTTRIDAVRDAFGVPATFHPIGAITVGYPDEPARDLHARRKPAGAVVHRGHWAN
ncbi:MAG: nitroreductase family protein [Actinomycetota bacterium]|jgi:nitroreductase|nr:nitroreductase family protein [Actinomycetota bacterium]